MIYRSVSPSTDKKTQDFENFIAFVIVQIESNPC